MDTLNSLELLIYIEKALNEDLEMRIKDATLVEDELGECVIVELTNGKSFEVSIKEVV